MHESYSSPNLVQINKYTGRISWLWVRARPRTCEYGSYLTMCIDFTDIYQTESTAMMRASRNGRLDTVKLLLDRGAKLELRTKARNVIKVCCIPVSSQSDLKCFPCFSVLVISTIYVTPDQRSVVKPHPLNIWPLIPLNYCARDKMGHCWFLTRKYHFILK